MKTRTDAKRAAILDIARQVFLEHGYERTSMAQISSRVGGSKATLYGYFPSKEALFVASAEAMGERYLGTVIDELLASPADGFEAALRHLAERLIEFLASDEAIATQRMVLAEAAHSDVGRLFYDLGPGKGMRRVRPFFEAAMASGRMRRADPGCAALHFFSLVQAETSQRMFEPQPAAALGRRQIKAMAERALDVFLRGYGGG